MIFLIFFQVTVNKAWEKITSSFSRWVPEKQVIIYLDQIYYVPQSL